MSQIWNIEQLPDVKQFKDKYVSCENKKSFVISHFFNILLDTSVHDFKVVPWYNLYLSTLGTRMIRT